MSIATGSASSFLSALGSLSTIVEDVGDELVTWTEVLSVTGVGRDCAAVRVRDFVLFGEWVGRPSVADEDPFREYWAQSLSSSRNSTRPDSSTSTKTATRWRCVRRHVKSICIL